MPGSIKFIGPYMSLAEPEKDAQRGELRAEIAQLKEALAKRKQQAADASKAAVARPSQSHVLTPVDFDSSGGANHQVLEDGSVLLLGDPPATDTYTVTVRTDVKGITGFKLEALTDPSLPGTGPGRGDPQRSNFILNHFAVTAAPAGREGEAQPVALTDARADYSQPRWDVSGAIDDSPKTGWAIATRFHEPHWATFRTAQPVGLESGTVLTFRLVQDYGQARTIGRLRLTALTGDPEAGKPAEDAEFETTHPRASRAREGDHGARGNAHPGDAGGPRPSRDRAAQARRFPLARGRLASPPRPRSCTPSAKKGRATGWPCALAGEPRKPARRARFREPHLGRAFRAKGS